MKNIFKFRSISEINSDIRGLPGEGCAAHQKLVKEETRTWRLLLAAYCVFAAVFNYLMLL
jgi:hypothetical protein